MGLQNWTILKPGMFPPFESQTSPVFGCQQYYVHPIRLNALLMKPVNYWVIKPMSKAKQSKIHEQGSASLS